MKEGKRSGWFQRAGVSAPGRGHEPCAFNNRAHHFILSNQSRDLLERGGTRDPFQVVTLPQQSPSLHFQPLLLK
ncbi:hypothetical protein VIGAN_10070000 [Vigna angularis var. angularis]|uniref:Uncharacterized protein n=1 Tax=Vigna angularis var. angularis TaxID=157739 RepID=A0A0S3T244_PHAAN|nr:hypothetical protein VIGAN_10070000 [Vigna angularis var. angularis]